MKIGVTANPNKPNALDLARRSVERLKGRAEVVLATETAQAIGSSLPHQTLEMMEAQALVAIGGDGTFLAALQRSRIPLLPVNAGTVGFLSEVDGSHLPAFDGALERLLRGLY
ncbi:MAG: NAD(+)/NADH kinase, partial [Thermoplasmata archaeon]|nr:NAD(+)/NADH kinase [Thermoplasmata archaeon]